MDDIARRGTDWFSADNSVASPRGTVISMTSTPDIVYNVVRELE